MPTLNLSTDEYRHLRQLTQEAEQLQAAEAAPWSVEEAADYQRICDELVQLLRPHLAVGAA